MRKAGLVVLLVLFVLPLAAQPSTEGLFRQFGLFGTWATDCAAPATPENLHVTVSMRDSGQIVEDHNLGPAGVINHYRIVSAKRLSATRLAVEVVFQPGTELQERQKLEWLIRNGTRRTMLNRPERGPPVVKDGIALSFGIETPVLKKCE
jgi:hypothetical protein